MPRLNQVFFFVWIFFSLAFSMAAQASDPVQILAKELQIGQIQLPAGYALNPAKRAQISVECWSAERTTYYFDTDTYKFIPYRGAVDLVPAPRNEALRQGQDIWWTTGPLKLEAQNPGDHIQPVDDASWLEALNEAGYRFNNCSATLHVHYVQLEARREFSLQVLLFDTGGFRTRFADWAMKDGWRPIPKAMVNLPEDEILLNDANRVLYLERDAMIRNFDFFAAWPNSGMAYGLALKQFLGSASPDETFINPEVIKRARYRQHWARYSFFNSSTKTDLVRFPTAAIEPLLIALMRETKLVSIGNSDTLVYSPTRHHEAAVTLAKTLVRANDAQDQQRIGEPRAVIAPESGVHFNAQSLESRGYVPAVAHLRNGDPVDSYQRFQERTEQMAILSEHYWRKIRRGDTEVVAFHFDPGALPAYRNHSLPLLLLGGGLFSIPGILSGATLPATASMASSGSLYGSAIGGATSDQTKGRLPEFQVRYTRVQPTQYKDLDPTSGDQGTVFRMLESPGLGTLITLIANSYENHLASRTELGPEERAEIERIEAALEEPRLKTALRLILSVEYSKQGLCAVTAPGCEPLPTPYGLVLERPLFY